MFITILDLCRFSIFDFLFLKRFPKFYPIKNPKLDADLYPITLQIINKNSTNRNSIKYIIFFISFLLKNLKTFYNFLFLTPLSGI